MISFFKKRKPSITTLFPTNFVDIHSHIIPGIDDGAKNLGESVTLLKRMYDYGIRNFIFTPHIMDGVWENSPEIIQQQLQNLKNHLKSIEFPAINISAAAEYLLDTHFDKLLKNNTILPLKDSMILVEMSYFNAPVNLYELLFNIQVAGYKPILAHPERYVYLHQNYSEYQKLKNAGCLFQLNLLSLSNYYGKGVQKVAKELLKDNFIDFVASDVHNSKHLDYIESIKHPKIIKQVLPILTNNAIFI